MSPYLEHKYFIEILTAAKEVIKEESAWTKGAAFRDKEGAQLDHIDKAVSFCPLGAFDKACEDIDHLMRIRVLIFFRQAVGIRSVADWNDTPCENARGGDGRLRFCY